MWSRRSVPRPRDDSGRRAPELAGHEPEHPGLQDQRRERASAARRDQPACGVLARRRPADRRRGKAQRPYGWPTERPPPATTAPTTTRSVFAASADGSTVAVGGDGADLLRVWRLSQSYALGVCALDSAVPGPGMALSGDGRLAAVVARPRHRGGAPRGRNAGRHRHRKRPRHSQTLLSRTGRYVAMQFQGTSNTPLTLTVVAVATDGAVANLARQWGFWAGFLFSSDERFLYTIWFPDGTSTGQLEKVDLSTGQITAGPSGHRRNVPDWTVPRMPRAGRPRWRPSILRQLRRDAHPRQRRGHLSRRRLPGHDECLSRSNRDRPAASRRRPPSDLRPTQWQRRSPAGGLRNRARRHRSPPRHRHRRVLLLRAPIPERVAKRGDGGGPRIGSRPTRPRSTTASRGWRTGPRSGAANNDPGAGEVLT